MRSYFFFATVAALILGAAPGHAADLSECATPEAMTAMLKAEGQRSIALADQVTANKNVTGMIFTMNADRSAGYILQSDQLTGHRATKFCVWARLINMRIFDARRAGLDAGALLKAPEADALRRCDELARENKVKRESCSSFNTMKRKSEAYGHHVILQGFVAERQPDGSNKPTGVLATLSGRLDGKLNDFPDNPGMSIGGSLDYSSLPDGATIINAVVIYPEYTPYGLSLLEKQ